MSIEHPNKYQWFIDQENIKMKKVNRTGMNKYVYAQFKKDFSYQNIKDWKLQTELQWDDFDDCDSGYCGI